MSGSKGGTQGLRIMNEEYPRVYFFRLAERFALMPDMTFEKWEKIFSRMMGIQGKALDEENLNTERTNTDYFTRFKERHPDQIVLLHFNGNARDPRYEAEEFFAGHWIYQNGAKVLSDVPAEEGETEIRVDNPCLFRTGIGRYRNKTDDIGICRIGADGKSNWHESEQVQLISADKEKGTICVRRGCFGTRPMFFKAGECYAAPHFQEGPWREDGNLMWAYNFSTVCPRDSKGRTASDVLVDDLVKRFAPGGKLAAFDGLEFDVTIFDSSRHGYLPKVSGLGIDVDNDGQIDQGVIDGVQTYGFGAVEFFRRIRAKFPQDKLLMADNFTPRHQRAFHILNGIESEGFPHFMDCYMEDWSGGLNRHFFWRDNARPPSFNYINHVYRRTQDSGTIPYGIHRMSFAAAVFTDSAISIFMNPPGFEDKKEIVIWDEFCKGEENELGWLGKPLEPPRRPAVESADLLEGKGKPFTGELGERFSGSGVDLSMDGDSLRITGTDPRGKEMKVIMKEMPVKGKNLFVHVTIKAEPMSRYPEEVARLMFVRIVGGKATIQARNEVALGEDTYTTIALYQSYINKDDFVSGFYYPEVEPQAGESSVDIEFTIEGVEPVWIKSISAHAHPDILCREFEKGLVVANPSPESFKLDLVKLYPGRLFRRLRGTCGQDAKTNDGSLVGDILELPAKDASFLVKR